MERWIPATLAVIALGVAGSASAEPRPSPFPLAAGNHWTLRDVETNAARTISVSKQDQALVVSGLPGAPAIRVRWAGDTLQAWDSAGDRWEALFRFGEPAGTTYSVRLGNTLLWRNVAVTVASKRARLADAQGRMRMCTRFTVTSKQKVADAGIESVAFAPGVGPMQIVEQTIAGTRELSLAGRALK
jgi:hypothetical protein